MRTSSIVILSTILLSLYQAPAHSDSRCDAFKPSAKKCQRLTAEFVAWKDYVLRRHGTTPLVRLAIMAGEQLVKRRCPNTWDNHYSADTQYECQVLDPSLNIVPLGVDSSLALINTQPSFKTVCMSAAACLTIVPLKLSIADTAITGRCSDPNDSTVLHLTNEEVQAKIDAVP
jgi:hypothetical protein